MDLKTYSLELEHQPFLSPSDESTSRAQVAPPSSHGFLTRRPYLKLGLLHIILTSLYTAVAAWYITSDRAQCWQSPNGMTDLQIKHKTQLFTAFQDSRFTGTPSQATDRAWHDLMSKMVIRISREELARTNQTSVELPEGGYMAWLGVFHDLHCIKMLREWNYRDHYYPNLPSEQEDRMNLHADHCLEMLRSSAMCHADRSLTTFKWSKFEKPMLSTVRPTHSCVDWDVFMESIEGRIVNEEESARLRNPYLDSI